MNSESIKERLVNGYAKLPAGNNVSETVEFLLNEIIDNVPMDIWNNIDIRVEPDAVYFISRNKGTLYLNDTYIANMPGHKVRELDKDEIDDAIRQTFPNLF